MKILIACVFILVLGTAVFFLEKNRAVKQKNTLVEEKLVQEISKRTTAAWVTLIIGIVVFSLSLIGYLKYRHGIALNFLIFGIGVIGAGIGQLVIINLYLR
jgi:hypothetical protein